MSGQYLTSEEVAARFRRSVDWLYDQVRAGKANPMRTTDSPTAPMLWADTDIAELEAALRPARVTKTRKPKRTRAKRVA